MIVIDSNNDDFFAPPMYDILKQIPNIHLYKWELIWLEGVSRYVNELSFTKGMYMIELQSYINDSKEGLSLSSQELIQLSTVFDDLIEIIIIGDNKENSLQKLGSDDVMKVKYRYFIELVDSSYWEVTTKDEEFIKNIKEVFNYKEE